MPCRGQVFQLEPRRAHFDAQRLDLGTAGDHAAVIIGENDNRHAFEPGIEYPLAGDVEIVSIDQGEAHRFIRWMTLVTTPHMVSS